MTWNGSLGQIIIRLTVVVLLLNIIYLILQSYLIIDFKNFKCLRDNCQPAGQATRLFSFDNLTKISHGDVLKIQTIWKEELSQVTLQGNHRCVTDQTIETGGQPERTLLITTWAVWFYLRWHRFKKATWNSLFARKESEVWYAQDILRNLFYCQNPGGRHTTHYYSPYDSFFSRNSVLMRIADLNQLQWDPTFTSVMCRKSPILAMKLVGLRLRHALPLLEDQKMNLKVIYLVRDPQATINSRLKETWCPELSFCSNFNTLCSDLVDDFNVAKDLERDYPQRFMVLRYEDVLTRSRTSNKFLQFLNMSADVFGSAMKASQLTKWKTDLRRNLGLVRDIRGACAKAMDVWGYVPIEALPPSTFN